MENIDLFGRGDVWKPTHVLSNLCHSWLSDGITLPSSSFPSDSKLLSYPILDNKMVWYVWLASAKVKPVDEIQK